MKHHHLAAASVVLIAAVAIRLAMPEIGAQARERISEALTPQGDPVEVFQELGRQLSFRRADDPVGEAISKSAPDAREETVVLVPVPAPTPTAAPEADEYPLPENTPETTEKPLPAVVTSFLARQSEFADYDLPDKVDYSYVELPFSFAVPVSGYNSSGFGYRLHPILNTVRFHYGTDFAAFAGERISAFADGTVRFAGYDDSYGYYLRIDHGDGWETLYAHCSALYVSTDQTVSKGDCVALVGATGLATGPHLHFELLHNGMFLNPEYYING